MRASGAIIQGSLAAVGLIAAYATWQKEPNLGQADETILLDLTRNDLLKIRYGDEKNWFELERKSDQTWIRLSAKPEQKTPERLLRAADGADKLLGRFAPLRASRNLGILSDEKLKELKLDAPTKQLEIVTRSGTSTYLVGGTPYNVSDPYVKSVPSNTVLILSRGLFSDLESAATRYVDRSLHAFQLEDFDTVSIGAGEKRRELVATGERKNIFSMKLAPKSSPDKPDETAKNWHDKVWNLRPVDALGSGELPHSAEPQILVRVGYALRGKEKGFIELAKVVPPPPPVDDKSANKDPAQPEEKKPDAPKPSSQPEFFARTEHTVGWMKLPMNAEDIVKEAEKISSGD